jgi:nickel/cobalt transporter (NicO) family protein
LHTTSVALLILAAGTVAVVHSILPDHWVPLALVARTQRWGVLRVTRISALASVGHVLTSVMLGSVIAVVGLQFQRQIDVQQGHLVGAVLVLTGLGFLLWGMTGRGQSRAEGHPHHHAHTYDHSHSSHASTSNIHDPDHSHTHEHNPESAQGTTIARQPVAKRLAAIALPFGVAASPDLTILPVALAASAVGGVVVAGVLTVFAVVTIATFIGLTVLATLAGYQIRGEWLERNATTITALVLLLIGIVAYVGF